MKNEIESSERVLSSAEIQAVSGAGTQTPVSIVNPVPVVNAPRYTLSDALEAAIARLKADHHEALPKP